MTGINPDALEARDVRSVIHGLTNLRLHAERGATVIERGHGVWVTDNHGQDYLEAMSGLWCIALGYGNERLGEVASRERLLAGVELMHNGETRVPFDAKLKAGLLYARPAEAQGLIVRAIGDTIAFCPPLIISESKIVEMLRRFRIALDLTAAELAKTAV